MSVKWTRGARTAKSEEITGVAGNDAQPKSVKNDDIDRWVNRFVQVSSETIDNGINHL